MNEKLEHKPCYGKCVSCVWKCNGGCSEWNGYKYVKERLIG